MDESIVINILALTGKSYTPSTRLRVYEMSPFLKKYGINIHIVRYPKSFFTLKKILEKEKRFNILWLQKKMPNFFKYFLFKNLKIPIIFDYDDNLLVRMIPKNNSYDSLSRKIKFNLIKNFSSGFTCGNKFLAEFILDTNKPFLIYPTPVPIDVPKKDKNKINNPIIIGWIGLSGGFMYLKKIMRQLIKMWNEVNFKLVIISNENYPEKLPFIENKKWNLKTQEYEIANFDIGIMPLNTSSPYDKGKCSYKLLQYMAAGVIPVGEAYGNNTEVIKNGVNGFLVYNEKWYETLKFIISDIEGIYKKMQKNILESIKKYSFEAQAEKLANFFFKFI